MGGISCLQDTLTCVYQVLLLYDVMKMRGLCPPLTVLRFRLGSSSGGGEIAYVVGQPHATGVHDPERPLTYQEVAQAIRLAMALCRNLASLAYSEGVLLPEEGVDERSVIQCIKSLTERGLLVIVPCRDRSEGIGGIYGDSTLCRAAGNSGGCEDPTDPRCHCYKTIHGEIARLAANASPLPTKYESVEALILPLLLEPRPGPSEKAGLPGAVVEYIKNSCGSEQLASILEEALRKAGFKRLNKYQYEVIEEYFKSRLRGVRTNLVLTAPTGAGKTLSFAIIVIVEALASKCRGERRVAAIVYPRKTLEREQAETIAQVIYHLNKLLRDNDLEEYVIRILLRDGNSPDPDSLGKFADIRGLQIRDGGSKVIPQHRFDRERACYDTILVREDGGASEGFIMDIKDRSGMARLCSTKLSPTDSADIVITNYNMLYKAALEHFSASSEFFDPFNKMLVEDVGIVVLDEVHTVMGGRNALLVQTYMLLRASSARDSVSSLPTIILSSATLLGRSLTGSNVVTKNIAAIVPLNSGPGAGDVDTLFSDIISDMVGVKPPGEVVYVDYYKTAWEKPAGLKATFWTVLYPSGEKKPATLLLEALVSTLHVTEALRRKGLSTAKSIAFLEYKSTLKDVVGYFIDRIVIESGDVYDRVLLHEKFDDDYSTVFGSQPLKHEARSDLDYILANALKRYGSLFEAIWSEELRRFHALSVYTGLSHIQVLVNHRTLKNYTQTICTIVGCNNGWPRSLLEEARLASQKQPWVSGRGLREFYDSYNKNDFHVIAHHGDYQGESRLIVDRMLEHGNPRIVFATSTLEVGLNVPGVIATYHYILPKEPGRVLQMVGRGGREEETRYTSMGIAVLRHNAWDAPKRVEELAIRYFLEIQPPKPYILKEDPILLASLCSTLGSRRCEVLGKNVIGKHTLAQATRMLEDKEYTIEKIKNFIGSMRGKPCSDGEIRSKIADSCSVISEELWKNEELRELIDMARSGGEPYLSSMLEALRMITARCGRPNALEAANLTELEVILDVIEKLLVLRSTQSNMQLYDKLYEKLFKRGELANAVNTLRAAIFYLKEVCLAGSGAAEDRELADKIARSIIPPRNLDEVDATVKEGFSGKIYVQA